MAFQVDNSRRDGRQPYCKACRQTENLSRAEELKAYKKSWYEKNRETVLERVRLRALSKPDVIQKSRRAYYQANAEKVKADVVRWQKANPHIVAWRSLLWHTLEKFGLPKEGTTIDLLGYSAEDLRAHIEALWVSGMSWDNHGEWHIDHKRPMNSFGPSTPPSIVNALSNLRPLWATTRIVGGVLHEGNLNRSKRWDGI